MSATDDNIFKVVWLSDGPGKSDLRAKTRSDHLTWATSDAINIEIGGPLRNECNEVVGSLLITRHVDSEILASDPYAKVGLFEKSDISTFRLLSQKDGDLPKSMYMVLNKDKRNSTALRAETRPKHLEWVRKAEQNGIVCIGGPLVVDENDLWSCGTFALCQADSIDESRQFAESDPYSKAGLFEYTVVQQFTKVIQKRELVR